MFPLPVTCLEEYMLCDDRPAYPMTIVFRLRFSGFLNREALEAALMTAIQRHPLARSTIKRVRRRRPKWIDHPEWRPTVEWHAENNQYGFPPAGHMDLTQQPGIRFCVVDRDDGHDLVIQVHHSCADGLGMNKLIEDLLIGYALEVGADEETALPELDLQDLRRRGAPGLTPWTFFKMAHKQAVGLGGARDFLMHRPAPLATPAGKIDEALPPPVFPSPLVRELDAADTERILATSKSLEVTANDLLVRDLFLAVGAWRKKWGVGSDRDWLRFSIPMSLRTEADERMPMANSVSSVFLDRHADDFLDAENLLDGIHSQMELIKRLQLQYTFILSLGVTRWMPGGIARATRADRCQLTCWMSNLGRVLARTPLPRRDGRIVAGDVELESVDYVIPLRPHVNAAFCAYTYAGRLRILMQFDTRSITDEQAEDLLATYVGQIQETIGN